MGRFTKTVVGVGIMAMLLSAQPQAAPPPQPSENALERVRPTYTLGPSDQITIRAIDVEEIGERPFRIDTEGDVNLPSLGRMHAGGMTVDQFEAELTERLKKFVRNPQVTVRVTEYHTEPVFVTGYFTKTGIIPLQGRRTLLEVLTSVGGVQPTASHKIKVTRHLEMGPIPLPNAVTDPEKRLSTADISLDSLRQNLNPAEDIVLQPLDTINVDKAEMVYVNGEVNKVGGIEIGDRDSLSIIKLMTMVGGLTKDAAPDRARVLRQVFDTPRRAEIPVDVKKIMTGKEADFPLMPGDVLYVPRGGKAVWSRVGWIGIPVATGLVYVLISRL
jgi:polysaccharide export outer membrane protein